MPQPDVQGSDAWRTLVFKNRGLLLVPVALALIIFGRPTLTSALVGIGIAAIGELLRIWAVGYSGVTTRADFVTAPQLVTAGPYSYVRNPLYIGNAMIAVGFWIAFSGDVSLARSALLLGFVVLLVVGVYATIIPLEEAYLSRTFGAEYEAYRSRVPRLVPLRGALPSSEQRGSWRSGVIAQAEIITLVFFALMMAAAAWRGQHAGP